MPNTESIALHDLSDAVDEDEYAQFLEQERIEFEQAASQQRKRSQHQQDGDYRDRTVSTRRRVREMDAMNTSEQILDYDEGFTAEASRETGDEARKILEKPQGKRIWWPEIRPLP